MAKTCHKIRREGKGKMKDTLLRYLVFIIGVGINSFGIAFITKSALGTSQISSVPYVMSLRFEQVSFGAWTFFFNMLFIAAQIVLLKRDFHLVQFLQIPANILFSYLIDASMLVLSAFRPELLWMKAISLLCGCLLLAIGIATEVAPDVITVPGEGIVRAISSFTKKRFGTVKVYFDVSLMITAAILSFLFFGELKGVGIGTLVSAFTVGRFVNLIHHYLPVNGAGPAGK